MNMMKPNNDPRTKMSSTGDPKAVMTPRRLSGLPVGPTAAPAPEMDVPVRLRAAYAEAPKLSDRALLEKWAPRALTQRAHRAQKAEADAYAAAHDGRYLATPDRPSYNAVIAGGIQSEDLDHAQHLQRLDAAERAVAAAESAAAREAQRQADKCRACGALDVPTRRPIVSLTVDAPGGIMRSAVPGSTVSLDGGPVCARCELAIGVQYRAEVVDEIIGKRRTRGDAARDYLRRAQAR